MLGVTSDIQDEEWIKYYVDPLDDKNKTILQKIMQPDHNVIIGRRGTGKSSLMARAFIECLYSLKEKRTELNLRLAKRKRILPVFLNMKEVWDPSAPYSDKLPYVMKSIFIAYFLSKIWISLNSNGIVSILNWKDRILGKTKKKIETLISKLINPDFIPISTGKTIFKEIETTTKNLGAELSLTNLSVQDKVSTKGENEKSTVAESIIIDSISEIMNELIELLKEYHIDACYIFFDEFSEIPDFHQEFLEKNLLEPYFILNYRLFKAKIAAYPGEYSFVRLDETRELISIPLDFVELYGDVSKGLKQCYEDAKVHAITFTESVIKKRLEHFDLSVELDEIFQDPTTALEYLFLTSMNVPRNIGHILYKCAEKKPVPFTNNDLKSAAIENVERWMGKDFIKKITQIYGNKEEEIMALWVKLMSRVMEQKSGKRGDEKVPQSHFWVDSNLSYRLKILEGTFLVLRIGLITPKDLEGVKVPGISKKYDVYVINKALCDRENLIFDFNTKVLARNRFDYSDIFQPFEVRCKNNHKIVNEDQIMESKGGRFCRICFDEFDKKIPIIENIPNLKDLETDPGIDKKVLKDANALVKKSQGLYAKFEIFEKKHNFKLSPVESELIVILNDEKSLKNKEIGDKMEERMNPQQVRRLIEKINARAIAFKLPQIISETPVKNLTNEFIKLLEKI